MNLWVAPAADEHMVSPASSPGPGCGNGAKGQWAHPPQVFQYSSRSITVVTGRPCPVMR